MSWDIVGIQTFISNSRTRSHSTHTSVSSSASAISNAGFQRSAFEHLQELQRGKGGDIRVDKVWKGGDDDHILAMVADPHARKQNHDLKFGETHLGIDMPTVSVCNLYVRRFGVVT